LYNSEEEEGKRGKSRFEEVIAGNFPNLVKVLKK
jgi:hypothetical protein